jgi:hypothetical protein
MIGDQEPELRSPSRFEDPDYRFIQTGLAIAIAVWIGAAVIFARIRGRRAGLGEGAECPANARVRAVRERETSATVPKQNPSPKRERGPQA